MTTLILRYVWDCHVVSTKLKRAQKAGDMGIIRTEMIIKWTVSPGDRLYTRREVNKTPKTHTFREWEGGEGWGVRGGRRRRRKGEQDGEEEEK